MTKHEGIARDLFLEGYNCAQAVFLAFSDEFGLDRSTCARMASSFGAGMGAMREVCGAVSGMFLAAGLLYGYDDPKAGPEKAAHYARIRTLADSYREICGSIICREILGLGADEKPAPSARTAAYYKKRPCADAVAAAAALLDRYMEENPR